ncbi:MAG TPA: carboxypeptidase-like regulatory domain-containing protein [Bryobacteraceae bacterium]|nr:carboxypeptidase-like regulatory domain-containing protein [Bryobacteraceae bacterium]
MTVSWKTRTRRTATKTGGSATSRFRCFLALLAVLLLSAAAGSAQDSKPKKGEAQPRSLSGIVSLPDDKPAARAVVLLENTKTKAIVSCYSQTDGSYFFHDLSPDVDYKVGARLEDAVSPTRTLGAFNPRKDVVINLKLEKKK